jgi:hypothetical protein
VVFLERKVRTSEMLTKRRTEVGLEGLMRLGTRPANAEWAGDWFRQRVDARRLAPTCQIAYRRTARFLETARGPIRLTCDREIAVRPATGLAFLPPGGTPVLEQHVVLEMKFCGDTPSMFRDLAARLGLVPVAVSKYRLSLEALGRAGEGPDSVGSARPAARVDTVDA